MSDSSTQSMDNRVSNDRSLNQTIDEILLSTSLNGDHEMFVDPTDDQKPLQLSLPIGSQQTSPKYRSALKSCPKTKRPNTGSVVKRKAIKSIPRKKSWIEVNDVFQELSEEIKRLINELSFAKKCLKTYAKHKTFIDFHSNQLKSVLNPNEWQEFEDIDRELNQFVVKLDTTLVTTNDNDCQLFDEMVANYEMSEESDAMESDDDYEPEDESKKKPKLRPIVCEFKGCGQKFGSLGGLRTHIQYRHSTEKPFVCTHLNCDFSASTKRYLNDHIIAKHTDQRPFGCSIDGCDGAFKTEATLRQHMKRHSSDQTFRCTKPDCDFTTEDMNKLKIHIEKHSTESPIKCIIDGCEQRFKNKRALNNHMRIKNHNKEGIPCPHPGCDYEADCERRLKQHMVKHSDERPFVCTHEGCGKTYKDEAYLKYHIQTHLDLQLKCLFSGCEETFAKRENLNNHMKKVHIQAEEYGCDWPGCEYRTFIAKYLRQHRRKQHCMEYKYVCDEPNCSAKFRTYGGLYSHRDVHTDVRPFACSWPGCLFAAKALNAIKKHEKCHLNERQFACDWPGCQYRSNLKGNVTKHAVKHQLK